jgi:hypothetical protein
VNMGKYFRLCRSKTVLTAWETLQTPESPAFSLHGPHNSANIVDRVTVTSTIPAGVPCAFVMSQGTGTHYSNGAGDDNAKPKHHLPGAGCLYSLFPGRFRVARRDDFEAGPGQHRSGRLNDLRGRFRNRFRRQRHHHRRSEHRGRIHRFPRCGESGHHHANRIIHAKRPCCDRALRRSWERRWSKTSLAERSISSTPRTHCCYLAH